jgi:predicted Zn-dependent peptidase
MRDLRVFRPSPRLALSSLLTIGLASSACVKQQEEAPPPPPTETTPQTQRGLDDILLASNLPGTMDAPIAEDGMGVTVHRLSNGMTVYISTDRQKPRVSSWIAVRTGSRNDPADSTGLAHYLEHMLFKGTDELGTMDYEAETASLEATAKLYDDLRAAKTKEEREKIFAEIDKQTQASAKHAVPNEISRLYGAMGVEGLNAFTSFDQTVYVADVPSNRFEAWAAVEVERFSDPAFRLFYPELEAVYEEKNRTIDNPFRAVWQAMLEATWQNHPYGTQTTIGEVEHLKVPAYGDMVEYFHKWYVPNNMAVILAGDIDAETALPVLEKTLGTLPAKDLEPPAPGKLNGPKGRVFREVVAEGEQGVTIAWPTVAASHPDAAAIDVMDMLVDNAKTGLLNVQLELSQKVPDAGSSHMTLHEAGIWSMRATAKEGQSLDEVEKLLLGVVDSLKKGEFTQADIDSIVLQNDVREKQSLEFAGARVSKIAGAYVNRMEWSEVLAQDEAERKVTKDEVLRVAAKYLGDDRVVVYRKKGKPELPKIDKPKITPVEIDNSRRSPFAEGILSMESTALEPDWLVDGKHYTVGELPAGRMIAASNQANDLFQVVYRFDRGSRDDKKLCLAYDLLERSGTKDMKAEALQKQLAPRT